jgi:hypothetical protein
MRSSWSEQADSHAIKGRRQFLNKRTIPWPPSKALEWTFVGCVIPPTKHGRTWELKCKFCAKEFKVTLITRIREHFLGTSNNIDKLGNSARDLATIERASCKSFEAKRIRQKKWKHLQVKSLI